MRYRARKTVRLGPIRLNFTQRGFASLDTPGPGGVTWGRKRAGR